MALSPTGVPTPQVPFLIRRGQDRDVTKALQPDERFLNFVPSWVRDLIESDSQTKARLAKEDEERRAREEEHRQKQLEEQRAYDERLAKEERERLERLNREELARVEAREDNALQRLVADAMAAGLSPAHLLGQGGSVAHAPPAGAQTASQSYFTDLGLDSESSNAAFDLIRSILPFILLIASKGTSAPATSKMMAANRNAKFVGRTSR